MTDAQKNYCRSLISRIEAKRPGWLAGMAVEYTPSGPAYEQLTGGAANKFIADLVALAGKPDVADRQRKLIISHAYKLGWVTPAGKADMERIDRWCCQYGRFAQPLMVHNIEELAKLAAQFRKVRP